ncbi:flagellar hook-basal body complex protein [Lachnospiraceae bacterium 45-P1]
MLRAMDSAVSGLRAHQNKLDVIGHNIANVNTFGFKSQSYSFKEAMYQTATQSTGGVQNTDTTAAGSNAAQYGYGTLMGSITTDMGSSTPTYVGGLNACINGQGFFITHAISSKNDLDISDETKAEEILKGEEFSYTRVGQFQLDSQGYLTDGTNFIYGFRPTDTGFDTDKLCALRVPDGLDNGFDDAALQAKSVKINELGEVTATVEDDKGEAVQVSLGKIAIVTFQNQEGLAKSGGSYYSASVGDNTGHCAATIAGGTNAKLMTGYLEASNVDLAKEFSELITTQRGFQANTKIITVSDEILSDLISMKR